MTIENDKKNQMRGEKTMMDAKKAQKNGKNQSRGKVYLIGVCLLALIFVLVVLMMPKQEHGDRELLLADVLTENRLEWAGFVESVEAVLGTDYLTYMDNLSAGFDRNDWEELMFPMEGVKAYVVFHNKPQVEEIKSVSFVLNGDLDEQGWYDLTQRVTESLSDRAERVENSSHFYFDGGEIWLDFGPVDQSEIQVHADGTSSYAGVIGAMGTRIETIWVEFD